MDYTLVAIPAYLILMAVEIGFALSRRKPLYHFHDTINNLSCGILSEIFGVLGKTAIFAAYFACFRLSPFSLRPLAAWAIALIGVDFAYYWAHRYSHRVNFAWAAHAVHHQSEEYNLSVALRQSSFQGILTWFFYIPLALVGVPPEIFLGSHALNLLYQFWIHTRAVKTMGPLEWVLNTPSHHRVHHGRNPKYIDRNYAGALIIWDRLFRTFQIEEEEPLYGITKPLRSWNPIWANFQIWSDVAHEARSFPRTRDRIQVWFRPPGWSPGSPTPSFPPLEPRHLRLPLLQTEGESSVYVATQFAMGIFLAVRFFDTHSSFLAVIAFSVMLFAGGMLEKKKWALRLEPLRLILTCVGIAFLTWKADPIFSSVTGAMVISFHVIALVLNDMATRSKSLFRRKRPGAE